MRRVAHYYDRDRRKGRALSATLHLLFLLLAIFGLPYFTTSRPPEEPMAISVEILPISEISNVRPSEMPAEEQKNTAKEAPPVVTKDAVPLPPAEPIEKPKEKKEEKPPESKPKEKPKPKEDDLAAVLKAVKDTAQKEKDEEKKKEDSTSKTHSNQYNPGLPMSLSEIDAVRSQIAKCWNVAAGAKDAQNLVVVLRLQLAPDGSLIKVELASESKSRYDSDSFFRAAADSARRAVQECSPLKNLPPEKYATWRDMEMTFDPKEMLF